MIEIYKSILAKFEELTGANHHAFYLAIPDRLYRNMAPESPIYPYGVFFPVTTSPDDYFTNSFEKVRIQFNLFSNTDTSTEVEQLFTKLYAVYDNCRLTYLATYRHVYCWRIDARYIQDPETLIHQYAVTYEIYTERL